VSQWPAHYGLCIPESVIKSRLEVLHELLRQADNIPVLVRLICRVAVIIEEQPRWLFSDYSYLAKVRQAKTELYYNGKNPRWRGGNA
jgi:hypothetical protein